MKHISIINPGLVLGLFLLGFGTGNACNVFCNSCADCTDKINGAPAGSVICLSQNIANHTGTCINNPVNFSNKTFDCQGHTIDGNNSEWWSTGIFLSGKNFNTIRNCRITEFSFGISLWNSSNNTIANNIIINNMWEGIHLHLSSNNTLTNNTINNSRFNFNIRGWEISHYNHNIDTSNRVNGKPIYYWTNEKNAPNNCRNLEINGLSNAGFVALISCRNITVRNLNLTNNSHGILLVNTSNSRILNNIVSNNRDGVILLWLSSNNTLINNTAANNNHNGISLSSAFDNRLINNTMNNNQNDGISLWFSSNNILTLNIVNNNKVGIYSWRSTNNTLINNIMNNNSHNGIELVVSSTNNTLINNTMNNNGRNGIIISTLFLHSPSNNNILINNTMNNNGRNGIVLSFSSNNNTLISNRVNNNSNSGIVLHSSLNNILTRNIVNNNNHLGIHLSSSSNHNTLTNNTVNNNNRSGIVLHSSNHNTLTNNTVNNNWGNGIILGSFSSHNTLTNNIANNNNHSGIVLGPSSSHNTLTNNIANNNSWSGIWLWGASNDNRLFNNTANNNILHGIYLDDADNNNFTSNTVIFNGQYGFFATSTSTGNILRNNIFCNNNQDGGMFYDIQNDAGDANIGSNNTCQTTLTFNDTGTTGCTYNCPVVYGVNNTNIANTTVPAGQRGNITYRICNNGTASNVIYTFSASMLLCPAGFSINSTPSPVILNASRCANVTVIMNTPTGSAQTCDVTLNASNLTHGISANATGQLTTIVVAIYGVNNTNIHNATVPVGEQGRINFTVCNNGTVNNVLYTLSATMLSCPGFSINSTPSPVILNASQCVDVTILMNTPAGPVQTCNVTLSASNLTYGISANATGQVTTTIECGTNIKCISNLGGFKNYATDVGCGANALANVLDYHGLSPNTPSGVHENYSRYFFQCPPTNCISDVNVSAILNNIRRGSSEIFTGFIVTKQCTVTPTITVCIGLINPFDLYKEIDASRPVILLITNYTGEIYTVNMQKWLGDNGCTRPIKNSDLLDHFVTVVGYTDDRKYLVIAPGYNHTTRPCTPKNGLVLIKANNLTDYRFITFR